MSSELDRDKEAVLKAAFALINNKSRVEYWYKHEPIADFRNLTAAELVEQGHADAVLKFLEIASNGASG